MHKLSIITVNFNNKEGLQKTIQSIESQTWQDFEFIVIDGGSTDGSTQLIEECQRINYSLSEKDNGVYNAMNKGIRMAKGEFVLFMNSGDCLHSEDTLSKVSTMLDTDYDILYGNNYEINLHSKKLKTYPDELTFSFFYLHSLCHQATFIRRKLFDALFYYNEEYKIASDWEFFIYAICYKEVSYKYINEIICDYDMIGISSLNREQSKSERLQTVAKYFKAFEKDYLIFNELNSKRIRQVLYIKKNRFAWRIMKWMIDLVLIFHKKENISN
jgi:glycosyltransferase involved in cell wall biosynthesis